MQQFFREYCFLLQVGKFLCYICRQFPKQRYLPAVDLKSSIVKL
jgi:hypothetical protein